MALDSRFKIPLLGKALTGGIWFELSSLGPYCSTLPKKSFPSGLMERCEIREILIDSKPCESASERKTQDPSTSRPKNSTALKSRLASAETH